MLLEKATGSIRSSSTDIGKITDLGGLNPYGLTPLSGMNKQYGEFTRRAENYGILFSNEMTVTGPYNASMFEEAGVEYFLLDRDDRCAA